MAEQAMAGLAPGEAIMFENVRFHLGEQLNQQPFVLELARLGDLFVNDAFATAHRAHASTSGLTAALPTALGHLMVQELGWVAKIADPANRPVTLLVGGNNIGPKLDLIKQMLERVDTVMLAGAVANTFIAARDLGVGQSMLDPAWVEAARDVLTEAGVVGCRLHLPHDVLVTRADDPTEDPTPRAVHDVGLQESICDIGPQTLATWQRLLQNNGTSIWLGCLGLVEQPSGFAGTYGIAHTLVENRHFGLVAGNNLLSALKAAGVREQLPAVSTGGAALATALLGQQLPCLNVMRKDLPLGRG
jgi:phosphoglycerate kinase